MRIAAVIVLSATTALSSGTDLSQSDPVTGTWRSEEVRGWTLVLESDGSRLTGAVSHCTPSRNVEIFDGRIEKGEVAFKCTSADGERTVAFRGRVGAQEIAFTWDLQVKPGGRPPGPTDRFAPANPQQFNGPMPPKFTMRRASDGAGQVILAEITERARARRPPFAPVSYDRIVHSSSEPQNWLTYSGTLLGHRFSPLSQITPANVAGLELAWIWPSQATGRFEATPLVAEGILYTVRAPNDVVALDAMTGEVLWTHAYTPPQEIRASGGGGRPNRGLSILDDRLFLGTLDAHLRAIDARTGKLIWDTTVANASDPACQPPDVASRTGCYVITHAPLVVKNRVIVGVGGGDGGYAGYGIRGFIAAFDAASGKEVWRFWTIPAPGEPGADTWPADSWKTGGAGVWTTGSYDPHLNLTYWGVGNPAPAYDGKSRVGDNLYSSSVVALDADTGQLRWHYQFTPHDEMDWDSAHVPVLVDLDWQGRQRKVMLWADKNGLMYVLDRTSGEFLKGKPFVEVNWMRGFDEKGRPIRVAGGSAADRKPSTLGGTNWFPPSYSPATALFYIPARERHGEGPGKAHGAVRAFDPRTGDLRWEYKRSDAMFTAGVLTTASGLLFTGVAGDSYSGPRAARLSDGYFYALDAGTGKLLWQMSLPGGIQSAPVTYLAGGTQYVAVNARNFLFAFALRR